MAWPWPLSWSYRCSLRLLSPELLPVGLGDGLGGVVETAAGPAFGRNQAFDQLTLGQRPDAGRNKVDTQTTSTLKNNTPMTTVMICIMFCVICICSSLVLGINTFLLNQEESNGDNRRILK